MGRPVRSTLPFVSDQRVCPPKDVNQGLNRNLAFVSPCPDFDGFVSSRGVSPQMVCTVQVFVDQNCAKPLGIPYTAHPSCVWLNVLVINREAFLSDRCVCSRRFRSPNVSTAGESAGVTGKDGGSYVARRGTKGIRPVCIIDVMSTTLAAESSIAMCNYSTPLGLRSVR